LAAGKIDYETCVAGDFESLDPKAANRVLGRIERALSAKGRQDRPLSGEFAGLSRLGVGDYRVVYVRTTGGYLVLRGGHRSDVDRKGRP
jgi:mRNA-degrading endonuclease RelE of RelBE toxin-antitoxin system